MPYFVWRSRFVVGSSRRPLQVDSVELVGLIIRFLSRASFAEIKLAVHPVSGTAVTLNGCMRLSSHNRSGGVTEVFLVPSSIVL